MTRSPRKSTRVKEKTTTLGMMMERRRRRRKRMLKTKMARTTRPTRTQTKLLPQRRQRLLPPPLKTPLPLTATRKRKDSKMKTRPRTSLRRSSTRMPAATTIPAAMIMKPPRTLSRRPQPKQLTLLMRRKTKRGRRPQLLPTSMRRTNQSTANLLVLGDCDLDSKTWHCELHKLGPFIWHSLSTGDARAIFWTISTFVMKRSDHLSCSSMLNTLLHIRLVIHPVYMHCTLEGPMM